MPKLKMKYASLNDLQYLHVGISTEWCKYFQLPLLHNLSHTAII